MATLSIQTITRSGLTPSLAAASAGGDEFPNAGNVFAYVHNGSAAPITVTVVTPQTVDGLAVSDRTVTIAAGADAFIGPFQKETYNTSTGNVQLTYSASASVTVAAISLTPVT